MLSDYCLVCREILMNDRIGNVIRDGLLAGANRPTIIRAIREHLGVEISYDSLRNHVRANHPNRAE